MDSSNENLVKSICIISERWPVAPFNGQFPDPHDSSVLVLYSVNFEFRQYSIKAESNFTVITFVHQFTSKHSIGEVGDSLVWNPEDIALHEKIARYVAELVNHLIDIVQGIFKESETNPFPHIRRVGIRDFVSMDNFQIDSHENRRGQGFSTGNLALDSKMAERSTGIVSQVNFSTEDNIQIEKIKILRAVELLNSGYHSEALLISFALLDSFVQSTLERFLTEKGVENPKKFLLRISDERMNTFLDPLLKTLTGHSLVEDKPKVWDNLTKANKKRNKAVHNSADISYEDAKQAIETTRDVLHYLAGFSPAIPNLGIDKLPFLFEINN